MSKRKCKVCDGKGEKPPVCMDDGPWPVRCYRCEGTGEVDAAPAETEGEEGEEVAETGWRELTTPVSKPGLVWVEGLIGAGKSTFTKGLSQFLGYRPLYEPLQINPFLERFYEDPERYGWAMQTWVLHHRYRLQQLAQAEVGLGHGVVLDRGLPGDRVFMKLNVEMGNIPEELMEMYDDWYGVMLNALRPPSLMVYLHVTPATAQTRIKRRGRDVEREVSMEYLMRMQRHYQEMLDDIRTGQHAWSGRRQGKAPMRVIAVNWNEDGLDPKPIYRQIAEHVACTRQWGD